MPKGYTLIYANKVKSTVLFVNFSIWGKLRNRNAVNVMEYNQADSQSQQTSPKILPENELEVTVLLICVV